MPYVTAVLVARNGAQYLPATIAALAAQTRRPDRVIAVDVASSDGTRALLQERLPAGSIVVPSAKASLTQAATTALLNVDARDDEWFWIIGHDSAPHRRALEALLGAVEVSPSVVLVGPKLMRWDDAETLVGFGETLDEYGRSVRLASAQLDQSQHDDRTDVLSVAAPGTLVLASVFRRLEGFDPGLPSVDAGLDLGIRARLAGHRVERVPTARIAAAGPVELFGRGGRSPGSRNRIHRRAALHRRMVYAPIAALPLLWLSLLPVAVVRALWQVLAKRPTLALGEIAAGLAALVDPTVPGARRRIARTRQLGWAAIVPLRVRGAAARELLQRETSVDARTADASADGIERPSFFAAGGAWVALLVAAIAMGMHGRLLSASALAGGALVPLGDVDSLWSQLGVRWRETDGGFLGAADPFSAVIAVVGSATWWSPSLAVVVLMVLAMPLAAITAWFAAARLSRSGWPPALAAIAWSLAPMFLAAIGEGQLPATIAHILLPALIATALSAGRSWTRAGAASLLFAAVIACAPILAPALAVLLVVLMASRPASIGRLILLPIPAAVLAIPLVIQQLGRGTPLALVADPGLPVVRATPELLDLLVGSPIAGRLGWAPLLEVLGLSSLPPLVVAGVLVAPLALLALLALFLPSGARAIPALVMAALGLGTAAAAAHLAPMIVGTTTAFVWPGTGLSLYWLGLIGAAVIALDALGRGAAVPALATMMAVAVAVAPLAVLAVAGGTAIQPSAGRVLPALVSAEAGDSPWIGTLRLTASGSDVLLADLERGAGTTYERISTLVTTRTTISERQEQIAVLAGNLASTSGRDLGTDLDALAIGFVLLADSGRESPAALRTVDAISGDDRFAPIGDTPFGTLWEVVDAPQTAPPAGPGPFDTALGSITAIAQLVVLGLVLLLSIPTVRRRRIRSARGRDADMAPAGDGEDDDATA
jgi:GT2 family glycosyltransferase